MVLPRAPLALFGTGGISAASGAAFWLRGGYDIKTASERIRKAGAHYDQERRKLEADEIVTNESLKVLGAVQEEACHLVVERMADFLRRHGKQVTESEKLLADGLESAPGQVTLGGSLGRDAISWMRGITGSAVTGAGIKTGVTMAVKKFATASTGTPISKLSGAAERNATLARLGGGSKTSGGAGKAVGAAALNSVAIGSAILVSGVVAAGQGWKAKTEASEYEAKVRVEIAEMQKTKAKFDAIGARAAELERLLGQLVVRATPALDLLESEPFDPAHHAARFQQALTLTMAVRDVASTQVVDESGDLNEETVTFKLSYRTLIKEADDE
jgi:hypothetical protein